ncbi:hypothetical protein [Streptomyces cellulosae]|uniref:Uncharacterized protein n=1 Tax=Streptomyces cellulosae TaxID=1968 RepID=A0ABW7YLI1_STRCE
MTVHPGHYARLVAKLERYDAYRNAPPSGRGNAARASRSHWQETYAGPSLDWPFPPLLFVVDPAPRRADPTTREAAFHQRAQHVHAAPQRGRRSVWSAGRRLPVRLRKSTYGA